MSSQDYDNQEDILNEAVEEYIESQLKGEEPEIDEFVKKYPEFEHQIREKIQNLKKVNTLFDSLVQTDESDFEDIVAGDELIGQKVESFEIKEMIGRGGMGIVYLARDTKLDRTVAIKSIPVELQTDPTAKMRFLREAKLLASLNHPNIAVIHDIIEKDDSSGYLVLEYIPGQTLAERIARKGLKVEEALPYAQQIAKALLAAHEQGIIHRDLKPGNIKITPEGRIKVLDFGLAKESDTQNKRPDITVTQTGRIVGTPAYMSPEQIRSSTIDHRTDIWSFGCVMFEMLTGHFPFEGTTATDTVAHILERDPKWDDLPSTTPVNIRVLIRRCLEKNLQKRLQHIGDALVEIRETINLPSAEPPPISLIDTSYPTKRQSLVTITLFCLLLISIVVCILLWNRGVDPSSSDRSIRRYVINPETSIAMEALWHHALVFSPDGKYLAYVEQAEDRRRKIYIRSMDEFNAKPLAGTEGAVSPFFSPGAEWIGYADHFHKKLKKVSRKGSNPMVLASCQDFHGGTWAEDGTIIFSPETQSGLWCISSSGEELKQLTIPDPEKGESGHWWPQILPGGKTILFTNGRSGKLDESKIEIYSLEDGQRHALFKGGYCARYVSTGHLLYARRESLYAVRFDPGQLKLTGDHIQVKSDIMSSVNGFSQFTFAEDGSFAYIPVSARNTELKPVWVDNEGVIQPLGLTSRNYHSVRISPDGTRVAFSIKEGDNHDIWICDLSLSHPTLNPLTSDGKNLWPTWFTDNKHIAFYADSQRTSVRQHIDGSIKPEPIGSKNIGRPLCCSPDGRELLILMSDPDHIERGDDIWVVQLEEQKDDSITPIIQKNHDQRHGVFSPDGKWLAYSSEETGSWEVYVESYPGPGSRTTVSNQGGIQPVWSRDGKELYYRSGSKIMSVSVDTDPELKVLSSKVLFEGNYLYCLNCQTYDIAPDGRFLMIQDPFEPTPASINIILNWSEELNRLVPKVIE